MISIVKRLGKNANGVSANIGIINIPLIYKDFSSIEENDGYEEIIVKYNKYKVHTIRNIMLYEHPDLNEIQKVIDL